MTPDAHAQVIDPATRAATRIVLKLATSLDGRIATAGGESQWITGPQAREAAHALRAESDAILIGSQTAVSDDPQLTVRLPGYTGLQPLRVVADARLRLPFNHSLVATAGEETPTLVVTRRDSAPRRTDPFAPNPILDRYRAAGVRLAFAAPGANGIGLEPRDIVAGVRFTLETALERLPARAPCQIMLEGGGRLAAAFLAADLVDAIVWMRAPIILGGDARPGVADLGLVALANAPKFTRTETYTLGDDLIERYDRRRDEAAPGS